MLKKERFNILCEEYARLSSVNPLEHTRRHLNVVARQVISLILKKKLGLSEYAIALLVEIDRSNVYHCITTAKEQIDIGRLEYIESLEYWQEALGVVPLDGTTNFVFALHKFIDTYAEANKITNEELIEALKHELQNRNNG